MIFEWFVGFVIGVVRWLLSWLPDADGASLPDFGPLFGILHSADAMTGGFVASAFSVIALLLTVNLVLFLYSVIRQLWSHVPGIGGR